MSDWVQQYLIKSAMQKQATPWSRRIAELVRRGKKINIGGQTILPRHSEADIVNAVAGSGTIASALGRPAFEELAPRMKLLKGRAAGDPLFEKLRDNYLMRVTREAETLPKIRFALERLNRQRAYPERALMKARRNVERFHASPIAWGG